MDKNNNKLKKVKGLSGSTLKLLAVLTMFIDHVGAGILGRMIVGQSALQLQAGDLETLWAAYYITRYIGRIAFPIYIFLLIEGIHKTRDIRKYALRLGLFALLSEIPFDLVFRSTVLEFAYQNIFFTLLIGLGTVMLIDYMKKKCDNRIGRVLFIVGITAVSAFVAELLHVDYGAKGIIPIVAMYLFYYSRPLQTIAGCITFAWEVTAPLAFIPIALYNGKRGWRLKYLFYIFYPLHLLVIYGLCQYWGIAGYKIG